MRAVRNRARSHEAILPVRDRQIDFAAGGAAGCPRRQAWPGPFETGLSEDESNHRFEGTQAAG
jgi:hypothetical protein